MFRTLCFAAILAIVAASPAFADTVRGRVLDPQHRAVPAASILVVSGSAVVATARTSSDGRFGPLTLPAGRYDVIAAATGFRADPVTVVLPAPSGAVDLEITLALAAVSDAVVVSAAQVDRPLSRVTDSVTVIDRAELDAHQVTTVADALRAVPGFGVIASGGPGAITSIFPRGGESDYTQVFADGLALNAFGGGFDAAHLAASSVDRIEVVRGPQSALFGSGAIGGVVNVITRGGGPASAEASIEGGGLGTNRLAASVSGSHRAWAWGAAVDRIVADGQVENDDYRNVTGSARLAWSDRATRRVEVALRGGRDERGNPGPFGSDPMGLYGGIDTVSRGFNTPRGIAASATLGDPRALGHRIQFAWIKAPSRYLSPYGDSMDETRRLTARYQMDAERGGLGLSAGAEILREQADNTYITGEAYQPVPVSRHVAGIFAESRWQIGARGSVTAGLRVERLARQPLESDPNPWSPRPAFAEDVVWSANPRLSMAWWLRRPSAPTGGWTRLRAGAGTGIKPPTAFEIAYTDNPSLRPERSRSVDVGVEHAFTAAMAADATWFANRYDDLIVTVGGAYAGASRYRTDNIANARAQGLELGLRWQSRVGLTARAAWTWLDTEVLGIDRAPSTAPSPYAVGDPLVRRPRQQGSATLAWTAARGSAFLLVNGRGTMADLEPNYGATVFPSAGYAVVSTGGSVRVARGLAVYGRVLNLLNRGYEETLGYPAPGRIAIVGLRVTAGR
jgi:outer membrane cobalamin receptor